MEICYRWHELLDAMNRTSHWESDSWGFSLWERWMGLKYISVVCHEIRKEIEVCKVTRGKAPPWRSIRWGSEQVSPGERTNVSHLIPGLREQFFFNVDHTRSMGQFSAIRQWTGWKSSNLAAFQLCLVSKCFSQWTRIWFLHLHTMPWDSLHM